jgi:pimeloyl-ACP methyl ester carboxylesterase
MLVHDRTGAGETVVLLHGWPGDRTDWRRVVPLLAGREVVVPDLGGFGDSAPAERADAAGQAALVAELLAGPAVLAGYDVGSRVAQTIAGRRPEAVRAMVLSPPMPGAGKRVLEPGPSAEFWYQHFHRLDLPETLLDGRPDAVRAYLRHFWEHWSGPGFTLPEPELERLVAGYGRPGRFVASIGWYRAGAGTIARSLAETAPDPAGRLATPTTVLWPEHDPLFPRAWSDRLEEFFSAVTLQWLDGVGHFSPLEAPDAFAAAIRAAAGTGS